MVQPILIVEDEADIANLMAYQLKQAKYEVELASDGERGLKLAQRLLPSLVILDLMLPGMDGLSICKILKEDPKTRHIPILMVTAKSEVADRITGFETGADDYLPKPFSPRELLLRIQAIFRRMRVQAEPERTEILHIDDLVIDPIQHQVLYRDKPIQLTMLEFRLLQFLAKSRGTVATRDTLLDQVWGYDPALTTRTVDTHVKRLRQKLGKVGENLETVRGMGYRWKA